MELICLGDSLTYGYGVRSAHRWSTLVGQALQCEVTNLGICGDTTGGMLVRLNTEVIPKMRNHSLGQRPFVLLLGGVNDIFYSGTDTGARANMGAMLQELLTAGARCALLSPLAVSFDTLTPEWRDMIRPACEAQIEAYHSWQAAFLPNIRRAVCGAVRSAAGPGRKTAGGAISGRPASHGRGAPSDGAAYPSAAVFCQQNNVLRKRTFAVQRSFFL